jgi:hypothetical protein
VIALYRLAQELKAGAAVYSGGAQWDIRGLIHVPILWAALFLSIVIGLLIVRQGGRRVRQSGPSKNGGADVADYVEDTRSIYGRCTYCGEKWELAPNNMSGREFLASDDNSHPA